MYINIKNKKSQSGVLILYSLVFMALLLTASAALLGYTTIQLKGSRQTYQSNQALYLAEAGIEKAISEINLNGNYAGESGLTLGDGEVNINVANIDTNNKRITATAYIPNSISPKQTKTIQATTSIDNTVVQFNYGIQVGDGGLTMANNSVINGNIFSVGNVSGSGIVTGDVVVTVGAQAIVDQQSTTQNANFNFGNASATRDAAQGFIAGTSGYLTRAQFYIKKVGNPGAITARLVTNNAGKPSKTVLASATLSASSVSTNYSFVEVNFSTPYSITAGQTYWLILNPGTSSSNYYVWGLDNTDAYSGGTGKYSANWNASTPVWNNAGGDLGFKILIGGALRTLSGLTINGSAYAEQMSGCTIQGNAHYTTINTCSVTGTSYPGTPPQSSQDFPITQDQITDWETTATEGGVYNGNYTVLGTATIGPLKINGDLVVTNNASLYLTGPVWVNGNITFSNNAQVRVDSSLGANGSVIIADNPSSPSTSGLISVSNNTVLGGNGSAGSYLLLISTKTGTAISLSNNTSGTIFYAQNGTISVSNNAGALQLSGYGISISNNATVTYQTGIQNASFSNGPGGSWTFKAGSYVIEP